MTRTYLVQSAILAWIVTTLLSITSGPMIKMYLSIEDCSNGLSVHKKLQKLNINTSSDFGGIKNTTELFFARLTYFLACVLGLSIILTILMIFPQMFYKKILYAAVVFFSLFTAAFIGLTIWSVLLYVDLYNEQIDPNTKTGDLHGQMVSSLKDYFRSDNLTTETKISNEWNQLFIDFECCGVNRVAGTTNDFDHTSWCTTHGSCQATASQIPKTCCKGFTENDYQYAPSDCHSSVSPGIYYDKGCFSVIKKEVIKEIDSFTDEILTEGLRVILVMGSCSFLSLIGLCVFIGLCSTESGANRQTKNASTMTEHAKHLIFQEKIIIIQL
uniref:Tetraspanin n=1 Tax=Magallana gigas TaxID=29159 RepID=A0A8W8KQF7_MAGGI